MDGYFCLIVGVDVGPKAMRKFNHKINPNLKNPHYILEKLEKDLNTKFKFLSSGDFAFIYKFVITNNLFINGIVLTRGIYVLKLLKIENQLDHNRVNFDKCINKLLIFSKLGIIPKIKIVTDQYIIMEYVHALPLYESYVDQESIEIREILWKKLKHIVNFLHSKGLSHGDLNTSNILISKEHIYLIDPSCKDDFADDLRKLEYIRKNYLKLGEGY